MIDLFVKKNEVAVPELAPGAEWVLEQPSIVHRLHDIKMDVELRKRWFYKSWYFEYDNAWDTLDIRHSKVMQEALAHPPFDSNIGEYTPQRYALIVNDGWRLVPDRDAVQLANFQNLQLHLVKDPEQAYDELKEMFEYVIESGAVFKSLDFKRRVQLHRNDFGEG